MDGILERIARHDAERAWLRRVTFPEEHRHRHTTAPWRGEYRCFAAPNVVCIETARLVRKPATAKTAA
jgi:hypothetical protein